MKSMAKEQTEITDHIKQYLSKADKFSVRMSAAITKSQAFRSKAKAGESDQNKLFVDNSNVNLIEKEGSHQHAHEHHEEVEERKGGCCKGCNFTPFVLMIALSFHSIFEGLALGLQ